MKQEIFKPKTEIEVIEHELKLIDFKIDSDMSDEKREMYLDKKKILMYELDRRRKKQENPFPLPCNQFNEIQVNGFSNRKVLKLKRQHI